jgi:hypothetical protein
MDRVAKIKRYISKEVKEAYIIKEVRSIINKSKPNRFYGTSGHKNYQNYLENELKILAKKNEKSNLKVLNFKLDEKIGHKYYQDDFDSQIKGKFKIDSSEYKKWSGFTKYMKLLVSKKIHTMGKNFEYTIKGSSNDKELILISHYDTVSHNKVNFTVDEKSKMPGADYNASGVSINLNILRLLNKVPLKRTIRFVFLDAASLALLGAYDYIKNLDKSNIFGVINLEMLGHDSVYFDKKKKNQNFKVYMRSKGEDDSFYNTLTKLNSRLKYKTLFKPVKNSFDSSDHKRFWDAGIPSVVYTQDWENDFNAKRYQSANDFAESLNQKTLYAAFYHICAISMIYTLDITK